MDALDAFLVTSRAQKEDKQRQTQDEQRSRQPDQRVPVLDQKVGVIRFKIDAVFCRKRLTNVAGDGHVGIVKALIGDVGVDLAHGACLVGLGRRLGLHCGIIRHKLFGDRRFRLAAGRCFVCGGIFRDVCVIDVEVLLLQGIDVVLVVFYGGKNVVVFYNVAPVIRQVLLLTAHILIRFVLIGAFEDGFAGIILHGEEKVAVFAGELLLVIRKRQAAAARALLQNGGIIVGGGVHCAVECVSCNVVRRKALGIAVAALIGKIQHAEAAEKEHDGKDRQQQQRRDLRPELALQLFHLESTSIL